MYEEKNQPHCGYYLFPHPAVARGLSPASCLWRSRSIARSFGPRVPGKRCGDWAISPLLTSSWIHRCINGIEMNRGSSVTLFLWEGSFPSNASNLFAVPFGRSYPLSSDGTRSLKILAIQPILLRKI